MRLAIVGSQDRHWPSNTEAVSDARELITSVIHEINPDLVVTGGADGVDTWAEMIAEGLGYTVKVYPSRGRTWPHFRARNILIAEGCDVLLCVQSKTATTYGSGWTADYAEKIGRRVKRVVL